MKKALFNPDIAVYSHHKTWLTELLIKRLPKGKELFESCRWEDSDACSIAFHSSKINLFVITPSATDLSRMQEYADYIKAYPHKSVILLSVEQEKNKKFSAQEKNQLVEFANSFKVPVFMALNTCASHIKHTYSKKGTVSIRESKAEFTF